LNDLLNSFSLSSIISFPTRITKNSRTAIDNIFIDIIKVENFITSPLSNGLSDHDAQIIEVYIHNSVCREANNIRTMRKINKRTTNFINKLSQELWQNIFGNSNLDVNSKFNSFLNTYLQIFDSCFPKIKIHEKQSTNKWLIKGIINSCIKKKGTIHVS
jgi:hypothetical protein